MVSSSGGLDGTGIAASFNLPSGIVMDANGNLFVADFGGHRIRRITPDGVVTTFAGSGASDFSDSTGTSAMFKNPPAFMVFDPAGDLYVSDRANNRIRRITPAGVVSTFAGSGVATSTDGIGTSATFNTNNRCTR